MCGETGGGKNVRRVRRLRFLAVSYGVITGKYRSCLRCLCRLSGYGVSGVEKAE